MSRILKEVREWPCTLRGAYALGIIVDDDYDHLYAVKKDSPLIIACGEEENYIASDVPAILKYTNKYIVLNDGEFAKISANKILVYDEKAELRKPEIKEFQGNSNDVEKNGYDHYMLKEIYEQPEVIKATTNPYIENGLDSLMNNMPDFSKYKKIDIVACGSAYHAGLIGKNLIEEYNGITCVGFMGGDNDHLTLAKLFKYVKQEFGLNVGWYSGKEYKVEQIGLESVDFIYNIYNIPNQQYIDFLKIGPYKQECGPLDSKTTNQMYFHNTGLSSNPSIMIGENETGLFWKK